MAQIFIAHSRKDDDLKYFFLKSFALTNVSPIFEELENIVAGKTNTTKIRNHIKNSKAVFILLSENVENIPHTRDFVVWESGVGVDKDIWVFEPFEKMWKISVVIPKLNYYVLYQNNDDWIRYISKVINHYDDSYKLPIVILTSLTGAAIVASVAKTETGEKAVMGGVGGALLGLLISDIKNDIATGIKIKCFNCNEIYNVVPVNINIFRCPHCNKICKMPIIT